MYRRIIVSLDGSDIAEQALPEAKRLAALAHAPIHLVRVVDQTQLPWFGPSWVDQEQTTATSALGTEEHQSEIYLARVQEVLRQQGFTVEWELLRGRAARELIAVGRPGDVMVMASHGRGGITRWLLGSVAENVVHRATVPVLLVRARDEAPDWRVEPPAGDVAEPVAAGVLAVTHTVSFPHVPVDVS